MAEARLLRVRGSVQGVGFRPHVARVARARGVAGWVRNDADGVTIAVVGDAEGARAFAAALVETLPPLARVDAVDDAGAVAVDAPGFAILASAGGAPTTEVAPDAALCDACREEIRSPYERRFRYPFTTCTHCGPRYAIVTGIPYDRAATTLAGFPLCAACQSEYDDETDRRYHAQPLACHACGPKAWLERSDGRPFAYDRWSALDMVDAVAGLVKAGEIVAVKGLGGFHLVCDATSAEAVAKLRARKHRDGKPFALMVRDLDVARRYVEVDALVEALLRSPAAPIVLAPRRPDAALPAGIAPGLGTLGVMLAATPLHVLALRRLDTPVVCTSGNLSDEPTCIDEAEARARLGTIADWLLLHDRPIAQRVDDAVVRPIAGRGVLLRRSRGYAPAPLPAPPGFADAPAVLALGGQLKSTFCLFDGRRAIPSQHFGDLDELRAFEDWQKGLALLTALFDHRPSFVAVDRHPDYAATRYGQELARTRGLELVGVQHHHAHVAACLFEHGHPRDGAPVLGVAFDGTGHGDDGTAWGGEFLLADYVRAERFGTTKPVALLGGDRAAREPWRNLYAQLVAELGFAELTLSFADLDVVRRLGEKPRKTLDAMLATSPRTSSIGRLFDAVAAAVGLRFEATEFEGQAAMELEALVDTAALAEARAGELYPIAIPKLGGAGIPYLEPLGLWRAILGDLFEGTRPALIAARFHLALADAVRRMALLARRAAGVSTCVLTGGVFQNAVLAEATATALGGEGFTVWMHERIPPNDGGIAVGQAAIAAARAVARRAAGDVRREGER